MKNGFPADLSGETIMLFEEFIHGKQTISPFRKISASDLDAFLNISGLHLPMFMDDESARNLGHQRRLVPGPMIFSLAMGLVHKTGWFDHVVAVLAFEPLRFEKAVHPEDSLKIRITVQDSRQTRNPNRGLVFLAFDAFNQKEEIVLSAVGKYLIQRQ